MKRGAESSIGNGSLVADIVPELDTSEHRRGLSVTYDPAAVTISQQVMSAAELVQQPNIFHPSRFPGGACLTDPNFAVEPFHRVQNNNIGGVIKDPANASGRVYTAAIGYPLSKVGGGSVAQHQFSIFDNAYMPGILGMQAEVEQAKSGGRYSTYYPLVSRLERNRETGDITEHPSRRNVYFVCTQEDEDWVVRSIIDGSEPHPIDGYQQVALPMEDGTVLYQEDTFLDYLSYTLGYQVQADGENATPAQRTGMKAYEDLLRLSRSERAAHQRLLYHFIGNLSAKILNVDAEIRNIEPRAKKLVNDIWPKLKIADFAASSLQHTFLRAAELLQELDLYSQKADKTLTRKGRADLAERRSTIFQRVIAATAFMELMSKSQSGMQHVSDERTRIAQDGFDISQEVGQDVRFTAVSLDETDQYIHRQAQLQLRKLSRRGHSTPHYQLLENLVGYVSADADEARVIIKALEGNRLATYRGLSHTGRSTGETDEIRNKGEAMPNGGYAHYPFEIATSLTHPLEQNPRIPSGLLMQGVVARFDVITPEKDPNKPPATRCLVLSGKDIPWCVTQAVIERANFNPRSRPRSAEHVLDGRFGIRAHMESARPQYWRAGRHTASGVKMWPRLLMNGSAFAVARHMDADPKDPRRNVEHVYEDFGRIPGIPVRALTRRTGQLRPRVPDQPLAQPVYEKGTVPIGTETRNPHDPTALIDVRFADNAVYVSGEMSTGSVKTKGQAPVGFLRTRSAKGRR